MEIEGEIMIPSIDEVKTAWPVIAGFLTPPQSKSDYKLLQNRLDQLEQEADEGSSLEILMDYIGELLDEYELTHFEEVSNLNKEDVTPTEILKRFIERNGLKQNDLAPIFSSEKKILELLNGKLQITLEQVKQLHDIYGLSISLFF